MPYTPKADGIGPTVLTVVVTVWNPAAVAEIVVVPGSNVDRKFTTAMLSPFFMVIDDGIEPMKLLDEERLITMSSEAFAGFPLEF